MVLLLVILHFVCQSFPRSVRGKPRLNGGREEDHLGGRETAFLPRTPLRERSGVDFGTLSSIVARLTPALARLPLSLVVQSCAVLQTSELPSVFVGWLGPGHSF